MLQVYLLDQTTGEDGKHFITSKGYHPHDGGCVMFNVDDVDLMQFTGLRDITNTEIYEGDILSSPNASNFLKVVWGRDAWRWQHVGSSTRQKFNFRAWNVMKVIGNIYEHPNLLEQ